MWKKSCKIFDYDLSSSSMAYGPWEVEYYWYHLDKTRLAPTIQAKKKMATMGNPVYVPKVFSSGADAAICRLLFLPLPNNLLYDKRRTK